jgi:GntR family transcriptional repressor for pyruvate dehydrogenase complex
MLGRVRNSPSGDMRRTSGAARNVTETVVARIEELVLGELSPGTELPSESELAAEMGVSRLTVREATKSLQARGLLEVRQGRRPVVAHLTAGPIGDFFSTAVRRDPRRLLDLLDVRRALEVHIASLAAANPSRAAVSVIETALITMRDAAAEGPDAIEQHARILDRVKARDPGGAAAAMSDHLEQTARDLSAALMSET